MSSDDCGGLLDYFEFFTASRKVFAIDEQRQELSSELHEVLAIMESNYAEETQKFKKIEKLNESISDRRRLIWDLTLSVCRREEGGGGGGGRGEGGGREEGRGREKS
jgi:hypothetical protein